MYKLVCVVAGGMMLAGCATVTRGTTAQVQIVSEPSGASARTSLGHQCTTPCTLQMSRKDEFSVVYTMPGYQDAQVDVKTQVAGSGAAGFAGNILLGGVVGMGVDAATGATYEHVPNPVMMTMQPLAARAPAPKPRKPAPRTRKPSNAAAPVT